MKKTIYLLLLCLLASCSSNGLRMGVALPGAIINDYRMTLNGETLNVSKCYGDSFVIAHRSLEANDPKGFYLLHKRWDGYYVPEYRANTIQVVSGSDRFLNDGRLIYDFVSRKVVMSAPYDETYGYSYLGQYDGLLLFGAYKALFFSDGRGLPLQNGVYAYKGKKEGHVALGIGAQVVEFPIADIRRAIGAGVHRDTTVEWVKNDIFLDPKHEKNLGEPVFRLDLELPKGNTPADRAIRRRLFQSIEEDAGSLLETKMVMPGRLDGTAAEAKALLDRYVEMWVKQHLAETEGEEYVLPLYVDLCTRQVADCDDYVTYFYQTDIYGGGLHGQIFEYYITYDKRRGMLLSAENSVKPSMLHWVRREALKSLQPQYLAFSEDRDSSYYPCGISLDAEPIADTETVSEPEGEDSLIEQADSIVRSILNMEYACDKWSGWNGEPEGNFTEFDFPLPHFAIVPEGIVLSYHPYQIDCFAAGDYHALIPFDRLKGCLLFDYSHHEDLKPQLWRFIEMRAK